MVSQRSKVSSPRVGDGDERTLATWLAELRVALRDLGHDARGVWRVEREAVRQGLLKLAWRGTALVIGGVVVLTTSVLGVVWLLRGLTGAITALANGRAWVGQVVVGAAVLLLLGLLARGLELRERRRGLERLKLALDRLEREREHGAGTPGIEDEAA